MAKNQMLNTISQDDFYKLVIIGTKKFNDIWNNGIPVDKIVEDGVDSGKYDAAISALEAAGLNDVACAIRMVVKDMGVATPKSKTVKALPTGKDLIKQFLTFVPFACVVPLRNRNHHKYVIGEPVIMVIGTEGKNYGMYGMDKHGCVGSVGNELPRLRKSLRPATTAEIIWIIDRLYATV